MTSTRKAVRRARTLFISAVLGVVLLSASAAQGAITYVQSAGASNNAASATLAVTFPSSNTQGNFIVAAISFDSTGGLTWSCSDSQGNAYSKATSVNDARHSQLLGICYAANVKAGANTATVASGLSQSGARYFS